MSIGLSNVNFSSSSPCVLNDPLGTSAASIYESINISNDIIIKLAMRALLQTSNYTAR